LAAAGRVYAGAELACDGALCLGAVRLDEMASLPDGDLEGVVECLLMVEGVEVAALLTERPGGKVKHSLRSRGRVDVAQVAAALSPTGGGHPKASGAVHVATIEEAKRKLVEAVRSRLGG
jgi:phosphoesterase RecJ-like protein